MSRDQFSIEKKFIYYNNLKDSKGVSGPLRKIQMLFHQISQTSRICWPPQSKLTIDESIVAFNGNHLEKAYIPHRPIKNGFKM